MRLFFAIWPPREVAAALHQWALRAQGAVGGRLTTSEKIHLTLAFLGEQTPERAQAAIAAARGVRVERHLLRLETAAYWPHNRIVWAGPRATPIPVATLAGELRDALAANGFSVEKRTFGVHITLIRKAQAGRGLPVLAALEWPIGEFALIRSTRSANGPSYEVLERFALPERIPPVPLDGGGPAGLE